MSYTHRIIFKITLSRCGAEAYVEGVYRAGGTGSERMYASAAAAGGLRAAGRTPPVGDDSGSV